MEVSHKSSGELQLAIAKHIGDIKCIGKLKEINLFRITLEKVFGELKYQENFLINTGITHETRADGSMAQHQIPYIQGITPMNTSNLVGRKPEEEVDDQILVNTGQSWVL